jgi:hypothetical protein
MKRRIIFIFAFLQILIIAGCKADNVAANFTAPSDKSEECTITDEKEIEKYVQEHNQEVKSSDGLVEIKSEIYYDLNAIADEIIWYQKTKNDELASAIDSVIPNSETEEIAVYLEADNNEEFNRLIELFKEKIIDIKIVVFVQTQL